jgi:hypothetical protein
MPRPKKNNADYFSHDADMRNNRKLKAVRGKFGIMGYGVYNMLLEMLTDADYNRITLNDIELELIAGDFGVSVTELQEIINFCVSIKLFQKLDDKLYCEELDDRLKPVYMKRERSQSAAETRQRSDDGKFKGSNNKPQKSQNNSISATEIPQESVTETPKKNKSVTKTPQSKVNKTKVKENTFLEIIDFYNKTCVSLPSVKLTPKRRGHINARIKEHSIEEIYEMIKNASKSSFLAGQNKRDWQATFDWLIRPNNFVKVLEGNYKDKIKQEESWKGTVLK